ncbi:transcription antitermination factor NusB [Pseudacidobacterium ailaaui]|jgi:N utilization substance protein B|uniref:transcription antitermination factor NusB n=1 Tax=Pseudacidobacterium ailaaui TaxID=1382359 RepID=UPI00047B9862|nr:transcription antitermination factor NusB [Pseudacidobacterium ailaaui]MDI3254713.1 transcription antitermination factor NusB [Bacillota bacterium]
MSAPGKRRKARELAMQMIFQLDMGKQTPDEVRRTFWKAREETGLEPDVRGFAEDLFRIVVSRGPQVDELIEKHSANWRLDRMASVDRNVLRMAVAEMIGFPGTPAPIIINEALEIARRYSAPESIHFLNGVLDAVAKVRYSSSPTT